MNLTMIIVKLTFIFCKKGHKDATFFYCDFILYILYLNFVSTT